MGKKIEMVGKKFGRLTVVRESEKRKSGRVTWDCVCECGCSVAALGYCLRNGNTKSCGCYNIDSSIKRATKHGLQSHKLYTTWVNMRGRCLNRNDIGYANYGGRGISVCKEWLHEFKPFYDFCMSNGWESSLVIDRIDNDGDYSPDNCRFVTRSMSVINRRVFKTNTSGFTGVTKNYGRYHSRVTYLGKENHVGYFGTIEEAVTARNEYIKSNGLPHKIQEPTLEKTSVNLL